MNTDLVNCSLVAKKQFQLGSDDTWLKFLTSADYNTKTQEVRVPRHIPPTAELPSHRQRHAKHLSNTLTSQVTGLGKLQLTKAIYNFTDTQDVRLRVGYEAFVDQKGNVTGVCPIPPNLAQPFVE